LKPSEILFNVVFTLVGAFSLWCVVTEDPANIVAMIANHPWAFKVAVAFIIVDAVVSVWVVDVVRTIFRRLREELGEDDE